MDEPTPPPLSPRPSPESGELLDHLLDSLFDDFSFWFSRGLVLLDHAPTRLMPPADQADLRRSLEEALRAISATRSMRAVCPTPVAVDLEVMAPWHRLMMRVWNLSATLRVAGVELPEEQRPSADGPG